MQVGHACQGLARVPVDPPGHLTYQIESNKNMLLPASQTAEFRGMMKSAQDCSLGVVPQQQPAIRGGRGHMTSLWQDHQSPEGRLVTPEGLQEGAALEGRSWAHVAIPAVQLLHSDCSTFAAFGSSLNGGLICRKVLRKMSKWNSEYGSKHTRG